MKEETPLRLLAFAFLVLVIGAMFCLVLAYAVLGLVQMTTFTIELISRGGYG